MSHTNAPVNPVATTLCNVTLREIIRRIVRVAQPDRIILFGSAARQQMRFHSDVDLLVIKSGSFHKGQLTEDIYRNLIGVDLSVDVVVVTPDEIERYRHTHCLVIKPAMNEGKEVYRAP